MPDSGEEGFASVWAALLEQIEDPVPQGVERLLGGLSP